METGKLPRSCRRYPERVNVRTTVGEKARILVGAQACGLSTSRYLVRCATEEREPPTVEERQWLEHLAYLVKKTGVLLNQLAHRTNRARITGEAAPPPTEVDRAAREASLLLSEIRRRL